MADNFVIPNRSAKITVPGKMNSQKATNVCNICMVLEANGMPLEDVDIRAQHPKVHELQRELSTARGTRQSGRGGNRTFPSSGMNMPRGIILGSKKMGRTAKPWGNVRRTDGEGSMLEEKGWEAVSCSISGLDDDWDQPQHIGSLPRLETEDENYLTLLEKGLSRVSTPKPDIAFGLKERLFNKAEI